jgi:hypothetical protein
VRGPKAEAPDKTRHRSGVFKRAANPLKRERQGRRRVDIHLGLRKNSTSFALGGETVDPILMPLAIRTGRKIDPEESALPPLADVLGQYSPLPGAHLSTDREVFVSTRYGEGSDESLGRLADYASDQRLCRVGGGT